MDRLCRHKTKPVDQADSARRVLAGDEKEIQKIFDAVWNEGDGLTPEQVRAAIVLAARKYLEQMKVRSS